MPNLNPDRIELLSTSIVLIDRLLDASRLRESMEKESLANVELAEIRARLLVDSARVSADQIENSRRSEVDSESPSLPVIFQEPWPTPIPFNNYSTGN